MTVEIESPADKRGRLLAGCSSRYLATVMMMSAWPTVLVSLAIAALGFLLLGRDRFWRASPVFEREPSDPAPAVWPEVVAVVPARDEAATVEAALRSLLQQRYAGTFRILLVDDQSRDATGTIVRRLASEAGGRLAVIRARDLPAGWSGKLWAMNEGLTDARSFAPGASLVLLTDADIAHAPDSLARLVSKAEAGGLDLVSLMVRLRCRSLAERLLIPPFVFFFQLLFPFEAVNDPLRSTAAAAGGCMLVRRSALEAAGGPAAIRNRLIDDVALAERVKALGGPIWLGLSEATVSLRGYDGIGGIWRMVRRTADEQLQHSLIRLIATVAMMGVMFVAPVLALLLWPWHGDPLLGTLGLIGWLGAALLYAPTARLYGRPLGWTVTLPLAAVLYTLMTVDSAWQHRRGRGGGWKGRTFGPPALYDGPGGATRG
jgi:hopene-associated glycosyltransferase HpnB